MKNGFIVAIALFIWSMPLQAQQGYIDFTHEQYDKKEQSLLEGRQKTIVHTAFKPYLLSRKPWNDSITVSKKRFLQRLVKSDWFAVDTGIFRMRVNPLIDIGFGRDVDFEKNTYIYGRGMAVQIDLGNEVSIVSGFVENQMDFAGYYTAMYENTGFIGGTRALPAVGPTKRTDSGAFDMTYAYGYLSYTPSQYFNIQAGHGRNFIGDGYRSLLLSDFSSFYPFLKLSTKVWKLEYTNLFTEFQNLSEPSGSNLLGRGHAKKYGSFHYLNTAIGRRLQVGIFEGIIWQKVDEQGNYRGLEVNYLNPVIFFRPVEFSLGSPDNALLGLNMRYDFPKFGYFYGQLVIDDINIGKILDTKGLGHINNKIGMQLGVKLINMGDIKGLNWRNEINIVRPYTYGHRVPLQSYTHNSHSLAHPLGANFREFISMASYQKGRWGIFATLMMASYGEDTADIYYGRSLFKSAQEDAPNVITDGNKLLQGDLKKLQYLSLSLRYTINTVNHIGIELKAVSRRLSPISTAFDDTQIISFSINNIPFNNYQTF